MNLDDFYDLYSLLDQPEFSSFDILAGEEALSAAEAKGIPAGKWTEDRVKIQIGQEMMRSYLSLGALRNPQESEARIRDLILRQISSRLQCLNDDISRKGMLLQALTVAGAVREEDMARMSQLSLEELQVLVAEKFYDITMNVVLPTMERQSTLLMQQPNATGQTLKNPGALAMTAYLESEKIRQVSEVAGAASVLPSYYNEDALDSLIMGLYILATAIVVTFLFAETGAALAAASVHIGMENTFVGLGAAVMEDITLVAEFFANMLRIALGSAVMASVLEAAKILFTSNSELISIPEHSDHYTIHS